MHTDLDVIAEGERRLRGRAAFVVALWTIGVGGFFGLTGLVLLSTVPKLAVKGGDPNLVLIGIAGLGLIVGYVIGYERAFYLRLEAAKLRLLGEMFAATQRILRRVEGHE